MFSDRKYRKSQKTSKYEIVGIFFAENMRFSDVFGQKIPKIPENFEIWNFRNFLGRKYGIFWTENSENLIFRAVKS